MDEKSKSAGGKVRSGRSLQDLDAPAFWQQLIDTNSAASNKAWEEVYAQSKGPSLAYGRNQLHLSDYDAEDLFHDVIERVMKAWPPKSEVKKFVPWFRTCLLNRFRDRWPKAKSKDYSLDSALDLQATLRSPDPLPEEQAMWEEEGVSALRAHERIKGEKPAFARVVEEMVNGENGEDYLSLPEVTLGPDGKPRSPGGIRTLIWTIRATYREYMLVDGNARRRDELGRGNRDVR